MPLHVLVGGIEPETSQLVEYPAELISPRFRELPAGEITEVRKVNRLRIQVHPAAEVIIQFPGQPAG